MSAGPRVALGFVASVTWGVDSLFALVAVSPLVSALRGEWPALGADALVAPGGLELLEFTRDRGQIFGALGLVTALLALARAAFAVGVDAWHARRLGSDRSPGTLVARMLAVRALGAVAIALLLAAAASPAYAVRHTPFPSLTTAGNVALAAALALPALALAAVASAAERVARGYLAEEGATVLGAIGRAVGATRARTGAFRGALAVVLLMPATGVASAYAARWPYGVGLLASQALLFAGAAVRAAAFARAVDEGRGAA